MTTDTNPDDGSGAPRSGADRGADLGPLIELLSDQYGADFSEYRRAAIARGAERRVAACGAADLDDYVARFAPRPAELDALYRELLIGAPEWFRDRGAFEQLGKLLAEPLGALRHGEELRAWVVGCASGEEAYSVAIVVRETLDALGGARPVRIFATDLHREALRAAGAGVYDEASLAALTAQRQRRWFVPRGRSKRCVAPAIRSMVVFAPHDLLQDVPLSRLDVITCRDLLVHLEPAARRYALDVFQYALKPRGLLVLGPGEPVSELGDDFEVIDAHWKIARRGSAAARPVIRPRAAGGDAPARPRSEPIAWPAVERERQRRIDELTQRAADADLVLAVAGVHALALDGELRLRWVTPHSPQLFQLAAADIGHRIDGLGPALREAAIHDEARRVIATGASFEQQVRGDGDAWYLLRILPRRRGAAVDGAVVTLIDITGVKRAEAEARRR
jgi:chemotaxis methyl-accepting protein methylase